MQNLNDFLQRSTAYLAIYLENKLPELYKDWWRDGVLTNLNPTQLRRIEQNQITSIKSLDLAALLRILDNNWFEIASKDNLPTENRHYIKEMVSIRNKWAHIGANEFPVEDTYRDFDTLSRFLKIIQPDNAFIDEVHLAKSSIISIKSIEIDAKQMIEKENLELKPGQIIFLKARPDTQGVIVACRPGNPENRFEVFIENEKKVLYESQIQIKPQLQQEFKTLSLNKFHAYLSALQIKSPGLSTLYSLNAARVDFIPYQFRPVLRFIRSDRPRILIADSVGVGKTIEAGLILRELQARRDINSVLIICPKPLVSENKWLNEMKRFDERFSHLDGGDLRYCINEMDLDGEWPQKFQKVILPYSLFNEELIYGSDKNGKKKHKIGLIDLDPAPRFDLVIVDEAHHIRNQATFGHRAVNFFCENAEAVVFLTATPIQTGTRDLFVLLNTLRPDLIIDEQSFSHMAEPNPFINQAIDSVRSQTNDWGKQASFFLENAASTPWGQSILRHNPNFLQIQNQLNNDNIPLDERIQLITDIENLHSFSGIINRTRRRDIGEFTIRNPETRSIEFTPSQKMIHDEVLSIQAEIFTQIHGSNNVKFMMTTIQRQVASCIFGLVPFLHDILSRHMDDLFWEEIDGSEQEPDENSIKSIEPRIRSLLEKVRIIDKYDPKLDMLKEIVDKKQALQNNKVMVFSSFRHTLNYLFSALSKAGFRVGLIHGGTPEEERLNLRIRFEKDRIQENSLDVLLFSEVGCEGLDYQFCDCIVNYDLPWNPMRIEQRIGRIDRNGQKSEKVAIFNLITPGTIDAAIYERCLLRIGVFNSSLGAGEEILGEITQEIHNIAENFSLSERDRDIKLQQLADNKIRLIQEQEELEQKQFELFGIRLPEEQIKREIDEATNYWITPKALQNLVNLYLQDLSEKNQEILLGEKPLKTLRLSLDTRENLLKDIQKLENRNSPIFREWEKYLKGSDPFLSVTFDAECAIENPKAIFLIPIHPLIRQAANALSFQNHPFIHLKVESDSIPRGEYEFAIYQWQFHGVREELKMIPITESKLVSKELISLFEISKQSSTNDDASLSNSAIENLDASHYKIWLDARIKYQLKTKEIVSFQIESLQISHRARINLLNEQLSNSSDEKIQRMRRSQIATAESDYARHRQDLEIAIERADIITEPVAYGKIEIF